MEDQLLIAIYSDLQIMYGETFIVAVGNKNGSWAIKILDMISIEVGDVRSIIDHNCFET
jgi:hypothetical protein